jgi:uncharacterized protein
MLVSFAVSNFRSFGAKQTFSLIASTRLGSAHEDHALPIPDSDERVLRAGVIYGANGAGKSNLLAALRYARTIILRQSKEACGTGRNPFRLADLCDQASTFDLQFIAADKLYRYALSLDDERIIEERLLHVVGSRQGLIYERRTGGRGRVEISAPGLTGGSDRLKAVIKVGCRHNQSFLATTRAVLEDDDIGKTLTEVIDWLDNGLTLIGPEPTPNLSIERLATDVEFRQFAGDFLKASSTGIDYLKLDKEELSRDEAQMLVRSLARENQLETSGLRMSNGAALLIEHGKGGRRFYQVAIQAVHQHATRKETTLAWSEESDGTQRLLDLLPAAYQMKPGKFVYFIDAIDRSLHPLLVYEFLECFLRRCTRTPCQIIVTTHESHLLDLDLLRRDAIWFAEKSPTGATNLYPLTDFTVRKDLHVQKGYLRGRFGAVPSLGEIDRLLRRDGVNHEGRESVSETRSPPARLA